MRLLLLLSALAGASARVHHPDLHARRALVARPVLLQHAHALRPPVPGTDRSAAQATSAAADLLALRGGQGDSVLLKVQQSYLGIPTLTRSWFTLIMAFAALAQVGVLQPEAVALDARAIVHGWQFWRPYTAAAFFGGVGPQLIQKLYYLISFGRDLERTLGIGEYARVMVSCGARLTGTACPPAPALRPAHAAEGRDIRRTMLTPRVESIPRQPYTFN